MEHSIDVKQTAVQQIANGRKTLEVGVADIQRSQVATGDTLIFNDQYRRVVTAIRQYASFRLMLQHEEIGHITPGVARDQILHDLQKIYNLEHEIKGVLVFELAIA